jgi:putative ABC transport system ATP-binding protein
MIEVKSARKIFHAGTPAEFAALREVTLSIEPRTVTVLKGPSGSGKTTLLSLIGAMARPTAGRITVFGKEITSLPERFLTMVRRSTFGFVFQQLHLIRGITAVENIMLPAYPTGLPVRGLRSRALDLCDRLGIAHRAQAKVELLSGGEAQRVAVARALINDPTVIIADEPTAHLDTALSQDFMRIVAGLRDQGRTVILASHDPLVYEAGIVDRVIPMRDGMTADNLP